MNTKNNIFIFFLAVFIYLSLACAKNINSFIPLESINEIKNENIIERNVRNLNYISNNNNKKNLIIGAINYYSWSKVKLYFISLVKAQIKNCDFVMFVGNAISNETIRKIEKCGVTTYKIPKEVLKLRTTIHNFRWKLYKDFLKENKNKYNLIFTADVRDTIFQKDVFQFYNSDKSFLGVFLEDGLMKNEVNRIWITQFCGEDEFKKIENETVVCSGTIIGTADKFYEFSYDLWYTLKNKKRVTDQGGTNYLIHSKKLFNDSIIKNDNHGYVLTIGKSNIKNIFLDNNDNILNYNGEIAAVVHQYDRKHSIASKMKAKFNDSYFYINNSFLIKERKNKFNNFIKTKLAIKSFFMILFLVIIIMTYFIYLSLKNKRKSRLRNFRKVKLRVYQQKEKIKKLNLYKKTKDYSLISQDKIDDKILI